MLTFSTLNFALSPVQADNNRWTWPMSSHQVVRSFDRPAQNWLPGHRGVDLKGSAGTEVLASGTGVITYAGMLAGKGVVVISHGAMRTTYEPVLATVSIGDRVKRGAVIGTLQTGDSHCSSGTQVSCLHWGLIRGDVYLNPLLLVKRQVRLLPMHADGLVRKLRAVGP